MAQSVDWLGTFIEDELRAVIEWKQSTKNIAKVKQAPKSRFSDDGSNFRSIAVPSTLIYDTKVQVSKVISTKDPVTVCLTDGFTHIKARLSEAAVSVLENEIDASIDLGTKGDVFAIREVTVISTPYGPPDEHIQLLVQRIEYLYCLRKPIGQKSAIEERDDALRLLEAITDLRHQQYALSQDGDRSPEPLSPEAGPGASPGEDATAHGIEGDTPKSQRSVSNFRSSPPSTLTQQSARTQFALATQVPTLEKANAPSLQKDGFQIEEGANLDRPTQAGLGSSGQRSSSGGDPLTNVSVTGVQLLSLLGKRKADAHPADYAPRPPSRPPTESSKLRSSPQTPKVEESEPPNAQTLNSQEAEIVSALPAAALPSTQPETQPHASGRLPPRDYSRRKIPKDQQKLLDRASSWLPSLPGHQFPHPNVPIELLKRWNAQMATEKVVEPPFEPTTLEVDDPAEKGQPGISEIPIEISESPSSESSSSEDEEIPASQWPPTPSQRRPMLPPDSTLGSNIKQSPVKTKQDRPPDSSEDTSSRPTSSHVTQPNVPPVSSNSTPRTPDKPYRATVRPDTNNSAKLTPSQRSARAIAHLHEKGLQSSPSQHSTTKQQFDGAQDDTSPPSRMPFEMHRKEFLPVRSNPSTPKTSLATKTQGESSLSASPTMLVKGTQRETAQDEEMEMSVPRSLGEDPALANRRKRAEHFKKAQRRDWIKQNYIPDSEGITPFGPIHHAYKAAHPKDPVKPSEIAEAIKDVYPSLHDGPNTGLKLRSPKQAENVDPPSQAPARPMTADLDGAVETPRDVQSESRMSLNDFEPEPQVSSIQRGIGNKAHVKPRMSNSLFAQFTAPRSSASSEDHDGTKIATSDSGRRLPWATASTQSHEHSVRSRVSQVVVGGRESFTPSKLRPELPPYMNNVGEVLPLSSKTTSRTDQDEISAESNPGPLPMPNVQKPRAGKDGRKKFNIDGKATAAPISVFSEFASAWKTLKPGGAFATPGSELQPPRKRQLNVLDWTL